MSDETKPNHPPLEVLQRMWAEARERYALANTSEDYLRWAGSEFKDRDREVAGG